MRVYVISEDREFRRSLSLQMATLDVEVWPFATAPEFHEVGNRLNPAPILLDLDTASPCSLDEMAGFGSDDISWPVLVASRREEFALAVRAMKLGAVDFLTKPTTGGALKDALASASTALGSVISARQVSNAAKERLTTLSTRQAEILSALLSGGANKVVAHLLGISVRTVEMHRAQILIKLDVRTLAEAAVLAVRGGVDLHAYQKKTTFSSIESMSGGETSRKRLPRLNVVRPAKVQPDRATPHTRTLTSSLIPPRRVAGEGPMR